MNNDNRIDMDKIVNIDGDANCYEILWGTGSMWLESRIVFAMHEQNAIDVLIDSLDNGYMIDVMIWDDDGEYVIDIDNNKYYDDEYISGGNDGSLLYHGGNLRIETIF